LIKEFQKKIRSKNKRITPKKKYKVIIKELNKETKKKIKNGIHTTIIILKMKNMILIKLN
jgi:hypothetical protein